MDYNSDVEICMARQKNDLSRSFSFYAVFPFTYKYSGEISISPSFQTGKPLSRRMVWKTLRVYHTFILRGNDGKVFDFTHITRVEIWKTLQVYAHHHTHANIIIVLYAKAYFFSLNMSTVSYF